MIDHRLRPPRNMFLGRFLQTWSASPSWQELRRSLMRRLPFLVLTSDVQDVVYLNWVVDMEAVRPWLPPRVTPWQRGGKTLLTILSYRHRHFGPAMAGPLRRLWGSPLQSNWRLYVDSIDGAPAPGTVLFLQNVIDSALYTAAVRLFSDALPVHFDAGMIHHADSSSGRFETRIDAGGGSAPELECDGTYAYRHAAFEVDGPYSCAALLGSLPQALEFVCLQHGAVTGLTDALAHSEISLPVDISTIKPARVDNLRCPWIEAVIQGRKPWAFVVPAVGFQVLSERLL